jgi:hypothetical protein
MKAATFVFLLTVCGTVMHAQTSATPSGDVTIALSEGQLEFCMGAFASPGWLQVFKLGQGPDDIALRLPLRLRYENRRSETIFLPRGFRRLTRMTVAGQNESTILRDATISGPDVKSLMALSRPEDDFFWTVAGQKDGSPPALKLSVLKFSDTVDVDDFVAIPVLVRSSGLDLRGKTVQIVTSRDFRSITPEVVEKLNEKWKNYGTVWARVVESDTLTIHIPQAPLTRNCMPSNSQPQ